MNVLKHRILSDEDVMQVIKPTHLCDIGNQIPHCILLASIKWVKLFGLWSVFFFFFFFFFFSPKNINWRGGYERPYYGLSYAIMKLRHINLKLLLSIIYYRLKMFFTVSMRQLSGLSKLIQFRLQKIPTRVNKIHSPRYKCVVIMFQCNLCRDSSRTTNQLRLHG